MNKVIGFAIWLIASQSIAAELWTWTPAADHHAAVVQVQVGNSGGTGCLVWKSDDGKKGVILTAQHVVEGGRIAKAIWSNGYQSAGLIEGGYSEADVACFSVIPPPDAVAVPVVTQPQPLGTYGEAVGRGGPDRALKHFWVKAIAGDPQRTTWQGVVMSGDSGGPIFVELDGQHYVAGTIIGGQHCTTAAGEPWPPGKTPEPGEPWPVVHPIYASKSHYCRAILTQCYGGQCFPSAPQYGSPVQAPSPMYPPQGSIAPPAAPKPVAPKPAEIDYAKLSEALAEKMATDDRFRGPAGVQGPQGVAGTAGRDGKTPDDAAIQAAVASWIKSHPNEIARILPPLYLRKIDGRTGEQTAELIPVHLGEGFDFIVTPPK